MPTPFSADISNVASSMQFCRDFEWPPLKRCGCAAVAKACCHRDNFHAFIKRELSLRSARRAQGWTGLLPGGSTSEPRRQLCKDFENKGPNKTLCRRLRATSPLHCSKLIPARSDSNLSELCLHRGQRWAYGVLWTLQRGYLLMFTQIFHLFIFLFLYWRCDFFSADQLLRH